MNDDIAEFRPGYIINEPLNMSDDRHEAEICENEDNGCKTTCCCGGHIDHGWDGHTPVSMHWWFCERNCDVPPPSES